VFAFKLRDDVSNYTVFEVSDRLREHGWLVPAYTFPDNRTDIAAMRIVIRNGGTRDLVDLLLHDLRNVLKELETQSAGSPRVPKHNFHH